MRFIIILLFIFMSSALHAEAMLYPMDGEPIDFSTLKGKWVFINYWASWCEPCLEEISELNKFYDANQKSAVLFAVNYDMLPLNKQKRLMKHYHVNYPALATDPSSSLGLGDIRGIPVTFVFNPTGQLVKTLYGGQKAADLRRLMMSTQ